MPIIAGTVEKITSKDLPSGTYYSFLMDDTWYRTNRTAPSFQEGNQVRFSFTEDKYGKQVDLDSVEVKEGTPVATKGATKAKGGAPRNNSEFWENKELRDIDTQKRISFQAATNTAISFIGMALDKGVIELPKSKKNADKLDFLRELVQTEVVDLFVKYQNVPQDFEGYMQGDEVPVEVLDETAAEADPEAGDDQW